ncbi:hypothetical protein [Bacillus massilinigeriensis]|uniref:hypothetical protein n=1 Tax=Bacillus mediterraneensis TaxID=1805474 RepID=UPI0008F90642|nr:hypothetical protein [Bacillus mediterraneensis]
MGAKSTRFGEKSTTNHELSTSLQRKSTNPAQLSTNFPQKSTKRRCDAGFIMTERAFLFNSAAEQKNPGTL